MSVLRKSGKKNLGQLRSTEDNVTGAPLTDAHRRNTERAKELNPTQETNEE